MDRQNLSFEKIISNQRSCDLLEVLTHSQRFREVKVRCLRPTCIRLHDSK